VWLIAVGFALLTLFTHTRIASPDDLAAWWIGARLVDQDMAHALYAVDRVDFSRYTGPEWAAEAEKIKEISPFAHPYVHLPLIAYLLAPLSSIMSYGFFAGVAAAVNGISFVLIAAGAISLWTRKPVPLTNELALNTFYN
jgi:alpha-1,2-mannosyltransferase